jgi:mannitol 2-dehydrogenase
VLRDLEPDAGPSTWFGYLTEAFARRRQRGCGGLTVLSCDNIQHNGTTARESICAFAALRDPALAEWIRETIRFPNSMVDRITPVTSDADRRAVSARLGADDGWPVQAESFAQWVLEDDFAAGRPPLEQVGVELVDDVAPYEMMKMRLLNGGHQALGYLGYLAGHRWVDEASLDPVFARFLRGYMDEATASLPHGAGIDPVEYKDIVIERFGNPHVRDTLARQCAYGSDRIPKFVLPVLSHNVGTGGPIDHAVAIVAGWARYCEGSDEAGAPIEVEDHLAEQLTRAAQRRDVDPLAFVSSRPLFGDLVDDARFVDRYLAISQSLHERGARATLEALQP